MNQEIIKQLKREALLQVNEVFDWGGKDHVELLLEKFAKLIVLDILKKIENEASTYAEPVWALELVNDIKDAYGIE